MKKIKYVLVGILTLLSITSFSQTTNNSSSNLSDIKHSVYAEALGASMFGTLNYQIKIPIIKESSMLLSGGFGHLPWV